MPFKSWSVGEKLTSSDVNTYLGNQTVSTFSSAGARNSAITSPTEGQLAYITSSDSYTYHDGSGWQNLLFGAAWIAYTPTLSNITLGSGGTSAFYYQVVGKQVNVRGKITLGTTGALTGIATFTLPVNSILADQFFGTATLEDKGVQFYQGQVRVGTNTGGVHAVNTAGTYGVLPATSATVPFTWGATDVIWVNFSYESV
jgi:hypothetical protein